MKTFVIDVHLGRLARDLRILGFDALWKDDYTDSRLLEISQSEGRILLTRDRALFNLGLAGMCHYVQSLKRDGQLLEVLENFQLVEIARASKGFLTRCLQCNSMLLPAKPDQVLHSVSGDIASRFDHFYFCPRCERVYWKGSHWEKMREWVQNLVQKT